jgi:hypothetical protein
MLKEMRNSTFAFRTLIVMCGALLFCCAVAQAQDVHYNALPGTNFAQFKTYKWVEIPGGAHPNQIVGEEIQQAVDSQLATKGLTKTSEDDADLYVGYQVAVQQEKQWNAFGMGGAWRLGGGMAQATSSTINIGSLVLDIYDVKSKQLVWTGTATKTIDPGKNEQKNLEKLQKSIAKLLKNYPPPA